MVGFTHESFATWIFMKIIKLLLPERLRHNRFRVSARLP